MVDQDDADIAARFEPTEHDSLLTVCILVSRANFLVWSARSGSGLAKFQAAGANGSVRAPACAASSTEALVGSAHQTDG
jgi:hypothetical protein